MKKRILTFILSLTMVFAISAITPSTTALATVSNCDLFIRFSFNSISANGVTKSEDSCISDGGFAVYPDKSTTIKYNVVVGSQSPSAKDVVIEEISFYHNSKFSASVDGSLEIEQAGTVTIDGVSYVRSIVKNVSLPNSGASTLRKEFNLTLTAPQGNMDVFSNVYCEISKGDSDYTDADSTWGNALSAGTFNLGEDDAKAFLNDNNLKAWPYGFKFEVSNGKAKIIDYLGSVPLDTLYIPSYLSGYPVTDIGDSAFMDSTYLFNTIFIPSSVVNIFPNAFSNSTDNADAGTPSVKKIIISEGVQWIGLSAFYNCCDLKKINIPSTVSTIKGLKISGCTYNCSFLSRGLYLYSELPNPSLEKIEVINESYADGFISGIVNTNDFDTPAFSEILTYGDKVYTVHYNQSYNGGDSFIVETRPVSTGDAVDLTLTANKKGNKFIGWNTYPTATTGLNSIQVGRSDVVLYAIFEKKLSSISIESKPVKTVYEIGESLNTNGLKLKITYDDGTYEMITSGFTTSEFTSTTAGTKTVKVNYGGFTTTFTIKVVHTHNYDSGEVAKNATCKETGIKTCTCESCGATKNVMIAKLTTHTYSSNCDNSCNVCGKTRTVGAHKYSNNCDTTCNYCNAKRTIKHTYSNNCDTSCNVCKATRTITHAYKTTTTKATLTNRGSIVKKCTVCDKVASTTTIKYVKSFKLSTTSYTYNGKVKTPGVIVKDSAGKTLKKNTDYTVSYASGRKNVGTYKVTIKMKGKYSGTKTLTFKINPVNTTISKLTAGKKSITVNISKKSTQVSGYQVQYSTSKKFTSAKTKTISSYKTTKYTLKSLSAKKTYYVRVRTYKTVSGKKYYSGWSTVKSVKTK